MKASHRREHGAVNLGFNARHLVRHNKSQQSGSERLAERGTVWLMWMSSLWARASRASPPRARSSILIFPWPSSRAATGECFGGFVGNHSAFVLMMEHNLFVTHHLHIASNPCAQHWGPHLEPPVCSWKQGTSQLGRQLCARL